MTVLQIVSNDDSHHAEDSLEAMRQRVAAGEFAGPLLHDAEQSAAQAYGATATPEVFVIDRAGVVRYHGAPDGNYDDASLDAGWVREALDDVLAGREVARPSTSPAGCSVKWRVELLWWEGCPTHDEAAELLEQILDEIGKGDVHIARREVRTRAEAQQLGFPGSPTFQVGGRDLFPTDTAPGADLPRLPARGRRAVPAARRPPTSPPGCATCWPGPGSCPAGWTSARSAPPPPRPDRPTPTRRRPPMASITFDQITKRYPDGTLAVDELDLDIADGEFLVLVGPSGCGKTTALRMAAGLEEISGGRLLIGDRVVNDVHPSQRDIAMVFQNYALYPHMSVRENIAFPLACAGVAKAEAKSRVERAAEILGLGESCTASRRRSPAASGSGSPWAARSCASRRRSSWTSRCRTSTPSCAARCARRSAACSGSSRPRPSTSRTTRSRP